MRIFLKGLMVAVGVVCLGLPALADEGPPAQCTILPVDQIKPGMAGLTYTVMKGNDIVALKTEIVGVAKNALGPGLDLIIGRLIDERTKLTGAVHGMSGSPLYVDGKLAGALSLRIATFEKDGQCGFTPITDMMKVENLVHAGAGTAVPQPAEPQPVMNFTSLLPHNLANPGPGLSALAVPLSVSGVRPEILTSLMNHFGLPGSLFVTVPGGGAMDPANAGATAAMEIKAGSPLAAVLMSGDINIAATGTCTWRQGNIVLGFGHPMFQFGDSALPMAGAEVVTTVPSYETPYKMTNTGKIVGTIYQDRVSAIAGVLGDMPPLATYEIDRTHEGESLPALKGWFAPHPVLTPMLIGAALNSALSNSLQMARTLSVHMTGEIDFAGHAPLKLDGIFSGEDDTLPDLLMDTLTPLQKLFSQTDEHLTAQSLHVSFATEERMKNWTIESVRTDEREVPPGGPVHVTVELREEYGARTAQSFTVTLPESVKSGTVAIRVGGSTELNNDRLNRGIQNARTVDEMIALYNQRRLQDSVYVQAVSNAAGDVVRDQEMPALPGSVRSVMEQGNSSPASIPLPEQVWLEMSAQLPGVVHGRQEVSVAVK